MRFCVSFMKEIQDVGAVKNIAEKCKISYKKQLTAKNKGAMIKLHRADNGGVFFV